MLKEINIIFSGNWFRCLSFLPALLSLVLSIASPINGIDPGVYCVLYLFQSILWLSAPIWFICTWNAVGSNTSPMVTGASRFLCSTPYAIYKLFITSLGCIQRTLFIPFMGQSTCLESFRAFQEVKYVSGVWSG